MKRYGLALLNVAMVLMLLADCGGGGSSNLGSGGNGATYAISGQVTLSGEAVAGVTISLTGATSASASTDASGNYSFTGLASGSHTVTPSKSGYTFTPASKAVTVNSANVTGQDFTATTTAAATYNITGQVTLSGSALAGVTVALTGMSSATGTTDASGNYSFTGLTNGSYTVTPSKSGYAFTPTSKAVTVNSANATGQDFTTTAITVATYNIPGRVMLNGTGFAGVTVALTGTSSGTATTDASGNYSFTGLANGTYTVTPSKSGYTFTPSSKSVSVNNANASGQDFTATATTAATYNITGQVTLSGSALAGVTVALTGMSSATGTTDASGNYSFTGLTNGSYTVTPSKSGYAFTPTSKAVTVNSANATGQDFTTTAITAATYYIPGRVMLNGTGFAGVTVALTGTSSGTATTDANGNYSFAGLANGTYTVTPSKSGFTFTPANKAVTINSADVVGQNFTATAVVAQAPWRMLKLPDTGQTTHFAVFGDDASYTINPMSCTDNGDGTITDNVTTLMWQKQAGTDHHTWDAAGTYCTGLSLGNHLDWRLPADVELMSIVDYEAGLINTTYFPNTGGSTRYWSSSTLVGTDYVWIVTGNGFVLNVKVIKVTGDYEYGYVMCVRGGQ